MLTVCSTAHHLHHGTAELTDGRMMACVERPERAARILERVRQVGLGDVIAAEAHGREPLLRVHSTAYLDFLETAHEAWLTAGREGDALPFCWPTRHLRQMPPEHIDGRLGYYCFDAGTPITAGTWRAATAAADVAMTAALKLIEGAPAAFALCRPPGHHVAFDQYGGYGFLNNAAIAAEGLRDRGYARVAILDVDYHHGNGTQAIFYERPDVFYGSIHADPAHEFPYFLGHAEERGERAGAGTTLNLPLPLGTGFPAWFEALERACRAIDEFDPTVVVVSLGVDTYRGDPISQFTLDQDDFSSVGKRIAGLDRPTLFVLEGGYDIETVGANVANVLIGFEGSTRA
ncbi:MAG: histone deacetylase family protein [Geminicoccaceae bacterium]